MTRVIHIRDSTGSSDEVYIGRAGKGHDGYFGNPVSRGKTCPECQQTHTTGGSTLQCYEAWLIRRMKNDEVFAKRVRELHGKILVCFCKPHPCHGDVLARYAKQQ